MKNRSNKDYWDYWKSFEKSWNDLWMEINGQNDVISEALIMVKNQEDKITEHLWIEVGGEVENPARLCFETWDIIKCEKIKKIVNRVLTRKHIIEVDVFNHNIEFIATIELSLEIMARYCNLYNENELYALNYFIVGGIKMYSTRERLARIQTISSY